MKGMKRMLGRTSNLDKKPSGTKSALGLRTQVRKTGGQDIPLWNTRLGLVRVTSRDSVRMLQQAL